MKTHKNMADKLYSGNIDITSSVATGNKTSHNGIFQTKQKAAILLLMWVVMSSGNHPVAVTASRDMLSQGS